MVSNEKRNRGFENKGDWGVSEETQQRAVGKGEEKRVVRTVEGEERGYKGLRQRMGPPSQEWAKGE